MFGISKSLFIFALSKSIKTISIMAKINFNKHIWEGWTVQSFINELELPFDLKVSNSSEFGNKPFKDKNELKAWCKDNQPYYKKYISDVVNYFAQKIDL